MSSKLTITLGQYSDAGDRPQNQDFYAVLTPEDDLLETKGICCVIADGLESCQSAAVASEQSVKSFFSDYYSTPVSWSVQQSAAKVIKSINSWFVSQNHNALKQGMITTFSALILKSNSAYLFHIGDTRIYRYRAGNLEKLTRDHSIRTDSNTGNHLNRALGMDDNLDVDLYLVSIQKDDLFIMTSNGVHQLLSLSGITSLIESSDTPEILAQVLVEAAQNFDRGENATAQVIRVDSLPTLNSRERMFRQSALPLPTHFSSGMVADGIHLGKNLPSNSHCKLFEVTEEKTGLKRVLKMPVAGSASQPYLKSFMNQYWVGLQVHSPHVAEVCETPFKTHYQYYLMEQVEGMTLGQWMRVHHRPTLEEVIAVTNQIAAAMKAFTDLEMLHRNIEPENIIINAAGHIKLVDFAQVSIASLSEIETMAFQPGLLRTRLYQAPETLLGSDADIRSELFSLASVVYEMLTGKLPYGKQWQGKPTWDQLEQLQYQSVLEFNPSIPLWVDGCLCKALSCFSEQRYDSLAEFLYDLKYPNQKLVQKKPQRRRNKGHLWKSMALVLLILNVLILTFFFIFDVI